MVFKSKYFNFEPLKQACDKKKILHSYKTARWKTFTRHSNDIRGHSQMLRSWGEAINILQECRKTFSAEVSKFMKSDGDKRLFVNFFSL